MDLDGLWTCLDQSGKTYDQETRTPSTNSYWNWLRGQPENNREECIGLSRDNRNRWHDFRCATRFRFPVVCEITGDIKDPEITNCNNYTEYTTQQSGFIEVVYPEPIITDNNDAYRVTVTPERNTLFEVEYENVITYTVEDIGGNTATCFFTVKIVKNPVGISFVVHSRDILFPTKLNNQAVGGDIMSAIIFGIQDTTNLSEPVILEFTTSGENPQCVFWDFNISGWSKEGCRFVNKTRADKVLCHCNHLTNFAALVDATYESSHFVLDLISKIGCGLSMFALFLTLAIFVAFRRLRIGSSFIPRKILIQLCTALFFLYGVFLVGIDQTSNKIVCIIVAALLHFLTLSSLMWMGVEAHNMYLKFVKVFNAQPTHFMLKASLLAWGLPLLITAVSLGAGFDTYKHLEYCFAATGPSLYFGVILPIAIILLHNFITFGMVMYKLSNTKIGSNTIKRRLLNAFAISVLMGLTWVFGFFAIEDAKFVFSLIFCLCNSLQGVAVFILFCARQEDVRETLRLYLGFRCCLPSRATGKSAATSTNMGSKSGGLNGTSEAHM